MAIDVLSEIRESVKLRDANQLTPTVAEETAKHIINWMQGWLPDVKEHGSEGDAQELQQAIDLGVDYYKNFLLTGEYKEIHSFHRWLDEEEILVFDIRRYAQMDKK